MATNVAVGVVRINVETRRTGLRDMLKDVLGIDVVARHAGETFVQMGERTDFLRQRAGGLKREISLLRNNILLLVFATAGVVRGLQKTVEASVQFQVALAGVRSVALATGNSVMGVTQAAQELTRDGLLTLSGAAQGLKNLLATGLNLQQSINLMKVFKDAAAFNRQGILEFEEAIVRATAGVKMQNARLIDDVGIRTRVGQMLERQGYQMEDLTNETTKAAAVQALYNGLIQEGRFFLGDASKLTDTYAGAQARLDAQLLRTRAAFGDILTGVSATNGIFSKANLSLAKFLETAREWIVQNKSLIATKLDVYFNKISDAVSTLWNWLKPIVFVVKELADFLVTSGGAGFLVWLGIISRVTLKLVALQQELVKFAGPVVKKAGIEGVLMLNRYGKNIDVVRNTLTNLNHIGEMTAKNLPFSNKAAVAQMEASMLRASTLLSQHNQGLITLSQKSLQNVKVWADLRNNINAASLSMKSINIKNIKDTLAQLDTMSKHSRVFATATKGFRDELRVTIPYLDSLATKSTRGLGLMAVGWNAIATGAKKAGLAIKAFFVENAPLLIFQAAIMAIVSAWQYFNKRAEEAKAKLERLNQVQKEAAQRQKDLVDGRLAELESIKGLAEEYDKLAKSYSTSSEDVSRMISLEDKITEILKKHGIALEDLTKKTEKYVSLTALQEPMKSTAVPGISQATKERMLLYDEAIKKASQLYNVEEALIKAIITRESAARESARSKAGAYGLMQLMPDTAKELGVRREVPEENIMGGTKYIADRLKEWQTLDKALASYNAGSGRLRQALTGTLKETAGFWKETPQYVKAVLEYYKQWGGTLHKTAITTDVLNGKVQDSLELSTQEVALLKEKVDLNNKYDEVLKRVTSTIEAETKAALEKAKADVTNQKQLQLFKAGELLGKAPTFLQNMPVLGRAGLFGTAPIVELRRTIQDELQTVRDYAKEMLGVVPQEATKDIEIIQSKAQKLHVELYKMLQAGVPKQTIFNFMGKEFNELYNQASKRIKALDLQIEKLLGEKPQKAELLPKWLADITILQETKTALTNIAGALDKTGVNTTSLDERFKELGMTLEGLTSSAKGGFVELPRAIQGWVLGLKAELDKSKSLGGLADKVIEAQERADKYALQLEEYLKKYPKNLMLEQAAGYIKELRTTGLSDVIDEASVSMQKMEEELNLTYKKLTANADEVEILDLRYKKLNKEMEINRQIQYTESAIVSLNATLQEKRLAYSKATGEQEKENLRDSIHGYQTAIAEFKQMLGEYQDYKGLLEDVLKLEIQRTKELQMVQKTRDRVNVETSIERMKEQYNFQILMASESADYAQQDAVYSDYKLKVMDLQKERQQKFLDLTESAIMLDEDKVKLIWQEINALDIQIEKEGQLYDRVSERLKVEIAYGAALRAAEVSVAKLVAMYKPSGAFLDIIGGGSILGGREAVAGIAGGMGQRDAAKQRLDAMTKLKEVGLITEDALAVAQLDYEEQVLAANQRIFESFENLFGNIASLAIDTFDIFGLKAQEASEILRNETRVDQLLLEDQFRNREITVKEYEAQRILLARKAGIEETRMAAVSAAEQKISIGNVLKALATEFQVKAIAAAAEALFTGNPAGFAAAAGYQAAAIAAGGAAVPLIRAGQSERARAEANARLQTTLAERTATRATATGGGAETAAGRSIGGTISAQELHIYISPTTTISGETVIISNIGIEEAQRILGDAVVERIQEAVENRELVLTPSKVS